jgi:hypothetical protein
MTYKQVHQMLRRVLGPANEKFCTAPRCDRVADEWALDIVKADGHVHYDDASRPYSEWANDYLPLCRPCHRKCDGNYRA